MNFYSLFRLKEFLVLCLFVLFSMLCEAQDSVVVPEEATMENAPSLDTTVGPDYAPSFSPLLESLYDVVEGEAAKYALQVNDQWRPNQKSFAEENGWPLVFEDKFDLRGLDLKNWSAGHHGAWEASHLHKGGDQKFLKLRLSRGGSDAIGIHTQKSFAQIYGYFEVRARVPAGDGVHSAFWLLAADPDFRKRPADAGFSRPSDSSIMEFDIFEKLGNNPTINLMTAHHIWRVRKPQVEVLFPHDLTSEFHTYGLKWTPTEVIWYIDNVAVMRMKDSPEHRVPHTPFFMLLNVYKSSRWVLEANEKSTVSTPANYPVDFAVDHVKAYKWPGSASLSFRTDFDLRNDFDQNGQVIRPETGGSMKNELQEAYEKRGRSWEFR